jgi:AraC-like DNA-binding protein
MPRPPKHLYLPAADRSYWQAPPRSDLPLLYLAWGRRDFAVQQIPASTHEGWVCAVVLEGSPTVLLDGRPQRLGPGHAVLAREDCPLGWQQDNRRETKLLVWMWRQPLHAALAALPDGFSTTTKLPAAARAECERLHRACREDVLSPDRFSAGWLDGVQRQLEVLLLRHLRGLGKQPTPARTVRSALDWMRQHLDSREPVARLCDYLGVSQPTLHRLFRAHAGRSALEIFRELRMEEARRRLQRGNKAVKAVATELGYAHFNDFSRAYRARFGHPPSSARTK